MTNPIDIIAKTIQDNPYSSTRGLAETIALTLPHNQIVANAVRALIADGWREGHEGPNGQSEQSDEDLANIARTVLRSVRGES